MSGEASFMALRPFFALTQRSAQPKMFISFDVARRQLLAQVALISTELASRIGKKFSIERAFDCDPRLLSSGNSVIHTESLKQDNCMSKKLMLVTDRDCFSRPPSVSGVRGALRTCQNFYQFVICSEQ